MRRPAASSMGYPFPWRPWPVLRARTPLQRSLSLSLSLSARSFGDPSCGDPNSSLFLDEALSVSELRKKKKTESSSEGSRPAAKDGDEGGEQKGVELERPLRGSH